MKKLVSYQFLHCFVKVAMSKKHARRSGKIDEKNIYFLFKINKSSRKKLVAAAFPAKIDKKTAMGASLFEKIVFLVDSGVPGGTRKLVKINGRGLVKGSWEPSGSHVGRLVAFFPILTSFWECLGSLWARFSINFSRFFHHREVGETARQQGSKTTGRQGVWQCSSTIADPRTQYGTSYHLRQCRSTILRQRPGGMRGAIESAAPLRGVLNGC